MISVPLYASKKIAVFGLARSGLSAAKALIAGGATIVAWDDDAKNRVAAAVEKIPLTDLAAMDWTGISALVLSPGVPHSFPAPHPVVTKAKNANVKIISDIYLLMHSLAAPRYIGITGTNGKSTTTTLIGHILRGANQHTEIGGNLGQAALTLAPLSSGENYVLELSSYQLELMPDCRVNIALLLNITPDHLDRHGGMDGYAAAKKLIFANQTRSDTAIIGVDDDDCLKIYQDLKSKNAQQIVPVSVTRALPDGIYVQDGTLFDATSGKAEKILDLRQAASLPGSHNWQNAAFAYAACKAANVSRETICKNIISFPGLAHRQEKIAAIDGIVFINDSKATNPEAAAKALACYKPIYWIAGGKPKGDDLDACAPFFGNIKHSFLIGEAANRFDQILKPVMPATVSQTLPQAIQDAFQQARRDGVKEAVVLLSPACASFDQFRDYEHRGQVFREEVERLAASNRKIA